MRSPVRRLAPPSNGRNGRRWLRDSRPANSGPHWPLSAAQSVRPSHLQHIPKLKRADPIDSTGLGGRVMVGSWRPLHTRWPRRSSQMGLQPPRGLRNAPWHDARKSPRPNFCVQLGPLYLFCVCFLLFCVCFSGLLCPRILMRLKRITSVQKLSAFIQMPFANALPVSARIWGHWPCIRSIGG